MQLWLKFCLAPASPVMSRKGGPRRTHTVAEFDVFDLEGLIQDVGLTSGFNFGAYNCILKSHAANGLGLLQNKNLLLQIGSITRAPAV